MSALPIHLGALPFGRPERAGDGDGRIIGAGREKRRRGWIAESPTDACQPGLEPVRAERDVQDWTDEELLGAYVAGDRAAFTTLVERYRHELLHFLTRFLGSRAAAEDVFQDTFLQVHLSADTFDTDRRLKPWLFTIAANKGRDYHRKHGRRQPVSLSAAIGGDGDGQRFVDLMEADLPTPETPVADAERSRLVKQVVDTMPGHLREIILLSYFQRMSYGQIAESLEIPLGTVKSRLHTAVAAFARAWTAARGGDDLSQNQNQSQTQTQNQTQAQNQTPDPDRPDSPAGRERHPRSADRKDGRTR